MKKLLPFLSLLLLTACTETPPAQDPETTEKTITEVITITYSAKEEAEGVLPDTLLMMQIHDL